MTVWVLEREEFDDNGVFGVFATEAVGIAGAQAHMAFLDSRRGPGRAIEWCDEGVNGSHCWERVYVGQVERYPRPDCLYVTLAEWPVSE